MRIDALTNKGVASLGTELEQGLSWAEQADIASAFVTPPALSKLETALEESKRNSLPITIRLLFGLYQRFTPPKAMSKMLVLQKAYGEKFQVKVAENSRFHWKLYYFRKASARRAYIGSANLTNDGLRLPGELCVRITAKASERIVQVLQSEFNSLWEDESFWLTRNFVNEYSKLERPHRWQEDSTEDDLLAKLLKRPKPPRVPKDVAIKPRIVFVDSHLDDKTIEVIRAQTQWDRNGWSYTCYPKKREYDAVKDAGVVIVIQRDDDNPKDHAVEMRWIEEADEFETVDGKYFVADSHIFRSRTNLKFSDVAQDFKRLGLSLTQIKRNTNFRLKQSQFERLCGLLRVKPETLRKR